MLWHQDGWMSREAMIERQIALDGLAPGDLDAFLTDDERSEIAKYKNEIAKLLATCLISDAASQDSSANIRICWSFLMLQLNALEPLQNIRSLLRQVYPRKAATKPQDVRKREEQERRVRALEALRPPVSLARKYLKGPVEYARFEISIDGAIDAYLGVGESYLFDARASEYREWLVAIERRQADEAQKQRAADAAREYNRRLNEEIARLTSRLDRKQKDLATYFRAHIHDRRCLGDHFDFLLSKEEEAELDRILVSVANRRLRELLPGDLPNFIILPPQYRRRYLPLPVANYSLNGVPCIDFSFEIFAAACAEVRLRPGKKSFDNYEFALPWIEKNDLTILKKPELLGYYHLILGPDDLEDGVFWQTVPLVLVSGLLAGETQPAGTTIIVASHATVTYKVKGYEEKVEMPNSFAAYLTGIGSIERMLSTGIVAEKIADIVKAELAKFEKKPSAPSVGGPAIDKDTGKAKAFRLFDQGKRPSDPEVKALGLKPSTAYRYYQDWKKTRDHAQS